MFKHLISIISFAAAFFAVVYGMDYYREHKAINEANRKMDNLWEEARKNNPNEPEILALQDEAIKQTEEELRSMNSQKEKLEKAAGNFFGFYLVNTRQRPDYCMKQGIDIKPFIDAFKTSHKEEYTIAISTLSDDLPDLDKLYSMLKPQFKKIIDKDMEYISNEYGISKAEACKLISDNANDLAQEMHISKVQPAVHQALMSNK